MTDDPLELLTLAQLSMLWKCSRRFLELEIAARRLTPVKLGRHTFVPRTEATRYVNENIVEQEPGE